MQELINKIADSYNPAYGPNQTVDVSVRSVASRIKKGFLTPLLAPMIRNRWLVSMLIGFGTVQVLLVMAGLPGWPCPIQGTLSVVCPGCGLSRAMALLLKGHWHLAVQTHMFAPVILLVLIVMPVSAVLPASHLKTLAGRIDRLERQSGIAAILVLSMIVYWLLRIFEII